MTVSNPATLSSANTEFSGNGTLSALVRGGSYVSAAASASISTTVSGLALSQFNGVTKPAANTPLSINGKTYSGGMIVSSGSGGSIGYSFSTNASTWSVQLSRAGSTGSPAAGTQDSGAVPSGSASCRLTLTQNSGTAMTTNNNAASALALGSTPGASVSVSGIGQNNPGGQASYNLKIEYLNSGGTVISTTNITWAPSWSGNV